MIPLSFPVIRSTTTRSLLLVMSVSLLTPLQADEGIDFFEKRIRPVLVDHCYRCHAAEFNDAKGGLTLDTREGIRLGGESGAAIIPGKPEESLLLEAVRYESFQMPPKERLSPQQIADLEKWISMGAPDPRDTPAKAVQQRAAADIDWKEAKQFWAFRSPVSNYPNLSGREVIDQQVSIILQQHELQPNPLADARILLRRLSFTLTGLPPSPQQTQHFLETASNDRAAAIATLTDSLLSSPAFGEHFAAMWLDISRYAEDQAHIVGNNKSLFFPNAWRYREWVMQAFNNDLPYDQFIRLQLAADLLTPDDPSDDVALGFIGLGPKYYRRNAPDVMADEWEDRVDVVSRSFLGLTVACARCHDHKFDPIPTEDYYALAGVFASTEMWNKPLTDETETEKNGHAKNPEESLHIIRDKNVRNLNVLIRGNVENPGEVVPRRFLQVLCQEAPEAWTEGSGRLQLAERITAVDNPLTARVIVNRIWLAMFGSGLVTTPSNFGALGEHPTHPRLLDELAVKLIENGWSLKWLIEEITASSTWQQSSGVQAVAIEKDPANRLLWRMNRRRLSAEQWRDALLTASGRLEQRLGGASIQPDQKEAVRRTVYSERSRFQLNPLLAMMDLPDPNAHAARRIETTTPLQKLFVMNHPFMDQQAEGLAALLQKLPGDSRQQIASAYDRLFQRPPTEAELELGLEFVDNNGWVLYSQALLASNEFLILD